MTAKKEPGTDKPAKPTYSAEERERRSKLGKLLYRWQCEGGKEKLGPFREWAAKVDPDAAGKRNPKGSRLRPRHDLPNEPPQPPRPPGAPDPSDQVRAKAAKIDALSQRGESLGLFDWLLRG